VVAYATQAEVDAGIIDNKAVAPKTLGAALDNYVETTSNTGSAIIPAGTTAERDVAPVAGYQRFNIDGTNMEVHDATEWYPLVGSQIKGVTGASNLLNIVQITQAGYDAITPDVYTMYVIVG